MYGGEYGGILLGLGLCLVLAVVFAGLSYVVSAKQADVEKVSAYECGFDPFDDTRKTFDVRFYLISLLFLVFDLETVFFLPWSVSISFLTITSFSGMFDFIFELVAGFIYAWIVGALEWE